uniref:Uncharacterized protein n=1 Tax=Glossina pallidipes TaxID=7398 RepID=A0A1B0ACM3_GLOPL
MQAGFRGKRLVSIESLESGKPTTTASAKTASTKGIDSDKRYIKRNQGKWRDEVILQIQHFES